MLQSQIYLTYQLKKEIIKCKVQFKLLYNNPIQRCILLKDGKYLVEYDYGQQLETARTTINFKEGKLAISVTYSYEHEVYFILCEGWRLYAYSRQLRLLHTLSLNAKYNVGMHYFEESLLLVGVEEFDLIRVEIDTNVKYAQYDSSIRFAIKLGKKIKLHCRKVDWNMGFSVCQQKLFLWGSHDLLILNLQGTILHQYQGIAKIENAISAFLYLPVYAYFVLGHQNGELNVWKSDCRAKKQEYWIHTFEGHTKQVESMFQHNDERLFWSASSDMSFRLWNLDQFENVYVISMVGVGNELIMLSKHTFVVVNELHVYLGALNNNFHQMHNLAANVVNANKIVDSLILTLDNNSAIMLNGDTLMGDLTKVPLSIFYPPPKQLEIKTIQVSGDDYVMLLEGGSIAIAQSNGIINQVILSDQIKDYDGNYLNQYIVEIRFLTIQLPCFDADFGHTHNLKQSKQQLVCGMSRGSVIAISLAQPKQLYARMSYHREEIISMAELQDIMLTFCVEGYLKIISFNNARIQCLHSLNSHGHITKVLTIHNKAIYLTNRGPFQVFKFKEGRFKQFSYDKGNEHESQVLSLDYIIMRNCIVSAAADLRIKVWTIRKILLVQLVIDGELNGAWFLQAGLLVAHQGKLSIIRPNHIKLHQHNCKEINQTNKDELTMYFEEYYSTFLLQEQPKLIQDAKVIQPQTPAFKVRKTKTNILAYAGGRVVSDDVATMIITRGKELPTEIPVERTPAIVQQFKKVDKIPDQLHDWDAMHSYEQNRKNRFQVLKALPKIAHSVEHHPQRVMTRRDLTMNRILIQSVLHQ